MFRTKKIDFTRIHHGPQENPQIYNQPPLTRNLIISSPRASGLKTRNSRLAGILLMFFFMRRNSFQSKGLIRSKGILAVVGIHPEGTIVLRTSKRNIPSQKIQLSPLHPLYGQVLRTSSAASSAECKPAALQSSAFPVEMTSHRSSRENVLFSPGKKLCSPEVIFLSIHTIVLSPSTALLSAEGDQFFR